MEETECVESDPERDGSPCNDDFSHKGADGECVEGKKMEESDIEEEQQEKVTVDEEDWHTCSEDEEEEEGETADSSNKSFHNSSRLLHKDELLNMFKAVHSGTRCKEGQLTVGLVGKNLDSCPDQVILYK